MLARPRKLGSVQPRLPGSLQPILLFHHRPCSAALQLARVCQVCIRLQVLILQLLGYRFLLNDPGDLHLHLLDFRISLVLASWREKVREIFFLLVLILREAQELGEESFKLAWGFLNFVNLWGFYF